MTAEPIKVVHVVSRLNVGGLAVQVLNMCAGLEEEDFECTIVTGKADEQEGDMLWFMRDPKRLHVIPELGRSVNPLADFAAFLKLCAYFRDARPDIVHTHSSKAGMLGRIAAWVACVPVVVHSYHGHVFRHYFSRPISWLIRMAEKIAGRVTNAVCVPSPSLAREISERFRIIPPHKARVVRYGIDVEFFADNPYTKESAREILGIDLNVFLVGTVGRLSPVKNHGLLVEAFHLLPDTLNGRRFELLIHGEGVCRADIERRIKGLGLTDRVRFVSWVRDLRMIYAAIDVLAITSLSEGMPISAIEAMASGVPVVSTAVGGVPDLLKGRGILISEPYLMKNVALALAEGLHGTIDKDKVLDFVREEHSKKALVTDTRKLYEEFLCRK